MKRYTLTESRLRNMIREAVKSALLTEGTLSDQEIINLANLVVKMCGNGNAIDLNDPQGVVADVKQVMQMERCNEMQALQYLCGANGGGWG